MHHRARTPKGAGAQVHKSGPLSGTSKHTYVTLIFVQLTARELSVGPQTRRFTLEVDPRLFDQIAAQVKLFHRAGLQMRKRRCPLSLGRGPGTATDIIARFPLNRF